MVTSMLSVVNLITECPYPTPVYKQPPIVHNLLDGVVCLVRAQLYPPAQQDTPIRNVDGDEHNIELNFS